VQVGFIHIKQGLRRRKGGLSSQEHSARWTLSATAKRRRYDYRFILVDRQTDRQRKRERESKREREREREKFY
jgi:hypothetical protein